MCQDGNTVSISCVQVDKQLLIALKDELNLPENQFLCTE